jgi:hypothetical protein
MCSTLPSKRVLGNEGILLHLMRFLGTGEWLFIAGTSRLWRRQYGKVEPHKETHFKAVYQTVPRLELAYSAGVDLAYGYSIGRYASGMSVILKARELGARWDERLCRGAASQGRLPLLKELHLDFGCPLGARSRIYAAKAPTPEVLIWLGEIKGDWGNERSLQTLMPWAAECGRIENGQWLRNQGAEWHDDTLFQAAYNNQIAFIQWARQAGCDWGRWGSGYCKYIQTNRARNTEETFDWLHEQEGFPCTCTATI